MIRLATEADFPVNADNEVLVRIVGLKRAYGIDVPFIQYYTDGEGSLLSVMDGCGVLHCPHTVTDEWIVFLAMNPDIIHLHCSADTGNMLLNTGDWQGRVGDVLRFCGETPQPPTDICESPYLPSVYTLLQAHFEGISSFNAWYPDVSHRIRHECSRIACVMNDNKVVSTAMTVAETGDACLLGQVATDPAFRRQGLAGKCINSLLSRCKGKLLYILPANKNAAKLYQKLGFRPCDGWAELEKTGRNP
ncbi:MAG: GNAT family N-acetyltransferase [Clostridia bacterium]|nr:GNAT family N-acetyltransferase [Clostridia bacterium]